MTHVQTLYSVSVSTYIHDDTVVSIAKSALEGYTGDYYFFQQDSDTYLLLYDFEGDWTMSNFGLSVADGCMVCQIDVGSGMYSDTVDSISGNLVGTETQVFSGSYTHREFSHPIKCESYAYSGAVNVSNVQTYAVYGSGEHLPHLIEGGQNYAYAAFMLAVGVIAFKLTDRLFRRIY